MCADEADISQDSSDDMSKVLSVGLAGVNEAYGDVAGEGSMRASKVWTKVLGREQSARLM